MNEIRNTVAMTVIVLFLAAGMAQADSGATSPTPERTGILTANVNVRADSDIRGAVISGLPKSTRVKIWQERQGWVQVTSLPPERIISGWVFGRFVKPTGTTAERPLPTPPAAPSVAPPEPVVPQEALPVSPPKVSLPSLAAAPAAKADPPAPESQQAPPVVPVPAPTETVMEKPSKQEMPSATPAPVQPKIQPNQKTAAVMPPPPTDRVAHSNPWPWFVRGVMLTASFMALVLAIGHLRQMVGQLQQKPAGPHSVNRNYA